MHMSRCFVLYFFPVERQRRGGFSRGGGAARGGRGGRGGSRGGRGGKRGPPPSADTLDAELDAYRNKASPTNGSKT